MVQAILEGKKSITRRQLKTQPILETPVVSIPNIYSYKGERFYEHNWTTNLLNLCPYGKVGDILWVRETFFHSLNMGYVYKATHNTEKPLYYNADFVKWKPSIFMPKDACRLFLKVKSVRVERLHEIMKDDAEKEGVSYNEYLEGFCVGEEAAFFHGSNPAIAFTKLWQSINGNWDKNPFVWVIEFERTEKPTTF